MILTFQIKLKKSNQNADKNLYDPSVQSVKNSAEISFDGKNNLLPNDSSILASSSDVQQHEHSTFIKNSLTEIVDFISGDHHLPSSSFEIDNMNNVVNLEQQKNKPDYEESNCCKNVVTSDGQIIDYSDSAFNVCQNDIENWISFGDDKLLPAGVEILVPSHQILTSTIPTIIDCITIDDNIISDSCVKTVSIMKKKTVV